VPADEFEVLTPDDLQNFAIPLLRSVARGEKLAPQWRAGKGWMAD
jgi:hypothetical protein